MLAAIPVWTQYKEAMEWGLRVVADATGSAGLSVIFFTIIIKTLLLPLTVKSVRSTYAMQELQPKLKELQKKYGKDRQRMSAEQMKLYQEHGVNPASGCLPMLLQMPIFFGLYFAIRGLAESHVGVWGNGFLWLPSLAQPDPYFILPILAGIFQFIQTRMTRPAGLGKPDDPQQQMMTTMTNFMPLMVVFFGWRFASGPVLYWVVQAVYSVVQQWFISGWGSMHDLVPGLPELPEHRRLGYEHPDKRAARIAAAAESGGGLFGKLQAQVQKQQDKVLEQSATAQETVKATGPGNGRARPNGSGSNGRAKRGGRVYPAGSRDGAEEPSPSGTANGAGQPIVPRRNRGKRSER